MTTRLMERLYALIDQLRDLNKLIAKNEASPGSAGTDSDVSISIQSIKWKLGELEREIRELMVRLYRNSLKVNDTYYKNVEPLDLLFGTSKKLPESKDEN